ncbi:hypothetical protein GIB67_012585 [Kingdonia uniflora]|uniref:Phosphoinositide phospholipase C n=1 Tax=Kingdonia uniflora TaxID=39325 RepID=A0A7J7NFN7_9MAGN|nr:hypothetical protein GIB67_012585 [Kingdonia uniflora]
MLFYSESVCLEEFPSPEAPMYRVILSTKPPKEYLKTKISKEKGKDSCEEVAWGKEFSDLRDVLETNGYSSEHNQVEEDIDDCDRRSRQVGEPEYKLLISIHDKKYKGGLKEALKIDIDKVGRLSLIEQALGKATLHHGNNLVRFTHKNLLRVYPKGTQFDSSNSNPLIGWMHGCQMVAFNMQGYDRSLADARNVYWLIQGMFRSNGGCGYVKKPDFLMKEDQHNQLFDPKVKLPVKKTLKDK